AKDAKDAKDCVSGGTKCGRLGLHTFALMGTTSGSSNPPEVVQQRKSETGRAETPAVDATGSISDNPRNP
ncbi:MAG TPA: hypothetical protein VM076_10935, partial [Gemmatimonadaceae bacterium]|nr:hypothetical protein [Gemmatimonadaceae bacterium]